MSARPVIAVLNGPNLNLLGERDPRAYGTTTLPEIEKLCHAVADRLGYDLDFRQTNHEGVLVDAIHELRHSAAGVVVNAAALSHTSVGVRDALAVVDGPVVEVHLSNIHRREAFRAHQATVDKVLASSARIITNANVSRLIGDGTVAEVEVEHVKTKETEVLPAQAVVAALGFVADLGPIQQWGLETDKRHIVVDSTTATNLPRVFAAGDITDYPGKVRLIAVGFGEAATAVNNAAVAINPDAHLFPGHSSEG